MFVILGDILGYVHCTTMETGLLKHFTTVVSAEAKVDVLFGVFNQ